MNPSGTNLQIIVRKNVTESFFFENIHFSYKTHKLKGTSKILSMVPGISVFIQPLEWSVIIQKSPLKVHVVNESEIVEVYKLNVLLSSVKI